MKRHTGLVSIITLNMNQTDVTVEFLLSLKKSKYKNFEVVVVDQNSKKDPTQALKNAFPNVIVVLNKINNGFTGGNNLAVEHTKGEFIFCVNNDTIITENLIGNLIEPLNDPTIGIVSPKIKYFFNQDIIQYAGYTQTSRYTGRNYTFGKGETDNGQHDSPKIVAYAHGCAMMIPYKIIEKIGFLDDQYFIYYEELDFSERVNAAGYKVYYNPTAEIYHKESMTTGKNSTFKEYYHTKNRILFMRKYSKKWFQIFSYGIYFILLIIPKKIVQYVPRMKFLHLKEFFRGIFWNLKNKV